MCLSWSIIVAGFVLFILFGGIVVTGFIYIVSDYNSNIKLHWEEVTKLFDVHKNQSVLPCKCQCPCCSSYITICDDISATGQWFYCIKCGKSGDMVELAAAYANMSVSDTISMLTSKGLLSQDQEGFSEGISNYFINNIIILINIPFIILKI